jgi:hypothetical protein
MRHPFNLRHIVVLMLNCSRMSVVPINGDPIPGSFGNHTNVGKANMPAKPIANL